MKDDLDIVPVVIVVRDAVLLLLNDYTVPTKTLERKLSDQDVDMKRMTSSEKQLEKNFSLL